MAITLGNPAGYVTSGLVLHLDASNPASYPGTGTTWTDLVGSGINATTTGSPTYDSVAGALTFNGSSQYATIADNTNLNSQAITLEAWCKPTTTNQDGFIFEKGAVNTQYSMFFAAGQANNALFYFRTQGHGGAGSHDLWFSPTTYITPGNWTHIVSTYASGTKSIYVNGALVAQATGISGTIPTTATGSSIGVYGGASGSRGYYFKGSISLVRVYNRALSLAEVTQNFSVKGITFSDASVQSTTSESVTDKGRLLAVNTYDAAGTYTWTKPAGCTRVSVIVTGGGGGGAGYCESGGAGGTAEGTYDVSAISTVAVTVGAGGAAVGYYAVSNTGGTSSFGSYASATGGYGSSSTTQHSGGQGGVGSGGAVNLLGGTGTGHVNLAGGGGIGFGGVSYWGCGKGVRHADNAGPLGTNAPGAGGIGARTDVTWTGGPGAAGIVVVYSYS